MALALCHEFAQAEGRQPRILVGYQRESSLDLLREICNTLADLGFNVDLAPPNSPTAALALQCAENDVDVFLMLVSENVDMYDLIQVQKKVLAYQPDAVLSLLTEKPFTEKRVLKVKGNFMFFDTTTSYVSAGLALLKKLLESEE